MDLFQSMNFEDLLDKLEILIEDLIKENDLPDRGVIITPNFGNAKKNKGQIISYSITANEPNYPASEEDLLDKNRHHSIFITLKSPSAKMWKGYVEIQGSALLFEKNPLPSDALKIHKKKTKENEDDFNPLDEKFRMPIDSDNLIEWIRRIVQYKISNYVTSASPFGCCSQFEACSDAKRCIHPNRMYSTACSYRHNLEEGRIFYGKNRNI